MKNYIKEAYDKKEYGWFSFFIIFFVLASMYGGALGAVLAFLVISGLYVTVKNPEFSSTKKVLFSGMYIIGGIVAYIAAVSLLWGGIYFFTNHKVGDSLRPEFQAAQQRPLNESQFTSNTAPVTLAAGTSVQTDNLSDTPYTNSKFKFSIQPPKDWIVDISGTDAIVGFATPSQDDVALLNVNAETATGYDLQTYAKNVVEGFFSSENSSNTDLKVVAEGSTTLGGRPAYQFEITSNYVQGSDTYPIHGVYVVTMDSNIGYVVFASSFEQSWSKHWDDFSASIASFRFDN
jgi:hypothetical protein